MILYPVCFKPILPTVLYVTRCRARSSDWRSNSSRCGVSYFKDPPFESALYFALMRYHDINGYCIEWNVLIRYLSVQKNICVGLVKTDLKVEFMNFEQHNEVRHSFGSFWSNVFTNVPISSFTLNHRVESGSSPFSLLTNQRWSPLPPPPSLANTMSV